jgi:beta-glucosidase-like glycosyl hydrolase
MQNYYQFIVSRLNGDRIKEEFPTCLSLVKKGIAGFIVFGGSLRTLRRFVMKLQSEAEFPLIIASDLERGLGQQLKGGTSFPPAMALASGALGRRKTGAPTGNGLRLLRQSFRALADEAAYAGINTIFAPVLDINTNPKNPIISVRAFGEDEETVSSLGCEMIRQLQNKGIASCGKHFPGHGETEVDSHVGLPVINRSLASLKARELKPFRRAAEEGVKMIMLGHLKVPALAPSGMPVSVSEEAVNFLRSKMHYDGVLTTDAMNMGGLGMLTEKEAARMALKSGVDIVLHPSDPEKIVASLKTGKEEYDPGRLRRFRQSLLPRPVASSPDFERNRRLAELLTKKAIRVSRPFTIEGRPFLLVLSDDSDEKGKIFSSGLRKSFPGLKSQVFSGGTTEKMRIPDNSFVMVALFSQTRAWKGGPAGWMQEKILTLRNRAGLFVSFGSPYLLDIVKDRPGIAVFWDSEEAQKAAAEFISGRRK